MSKFEEGRVYEFVENLFSELVQKDGGYYPSKHDPEVFQKSSEKFNEPEEEILRIYNSFGTIIAGKEVQKLNKLSKKKRDARRKEMLTNIVKNNRDLPYYD